MCRSLFQTRGVGEGPRAEDCGGVEGWGSFWLGHVRTYIGVLDPRVKGLGPCGS